MSDMFPDVVAGLLDELEQFAKTRGPEEPRNVGEVSPFDVQSRLPFIRVYRSGTDGASSRHTDIGLYTIGVLHNSRNEARDLAMHIESHLQDCMNKRGGQIGSVFIDSLRNNVVPFTLPATDDTVRLWTAVFRIGARRQA